jgi:predicted RNA-binding protein with RPS1 domain
MPRGLKGEERRERLADMVGDKVGLKVIEVDRHRRRLILSQRQARRAWQKMQRKRVMEQLSEGETASGTVTGITDFGAFVDLGGADGLIHISELSWRQVDDPREVVEVGDEVEVYVLNLDWDRTRIALSLKRLKPNPWSQVAGHYEVGELVEGTVSRVLDFGGFVQLGLGVEGLLHVSEMTGASQLSPTEILQVGQRVLVKIIGIDTRKQRITLSARQVHRDQWERWMAEHQVAAEEEEEAPEATEPRPEAVEESEEDVAAVEPEAVVEETPTPVDTFGEPAEEEAVTEGAEAVAELEEETEPTAEAVAGPMAEVEAEVEAEAEIAVEPEAKAEAEPEAETEAEPEAEAPPEEAEDEAPEAVEAVEEPEEDVAAAEPLAVEAADVTEEPGVIVEPEEETEPATGAEAGPLAEAESDVSEEAEVIAEPEEKTEPTTEAEAGPLAEAESDVSEEVEVVAEPEEETEPTAEAEPVAEAEPEARAPEEVPEAELEEIGDE